VVSSEDEGVCVDVVVTTVTDSDEVGPTVTVEEVVIVVSEVMSLVTEVVVVEPVREAVPESEPESVAEPLVPPVLKDTDWRLKSAIASSRGSAVTTDALSKPKRRKASDRMVKAIYGCVSR